MSPLRSRATAKRLHRLAKSHAAVALWKLCFRRLKKDGENGGISTGRKLTSVGEGLGPPVSLTHAAVTECRPCFRRLKKDGENGGLPTERRT